IVLVTHDPEVARHAKRVIHIKDGRVVDSVSRSEPEIVEEFDEKATPSIKTAQSTGIGFGLRSLPMPATLRTALIALRRNIMRSGLTALGIIIGIAAVIAMMEIGSGSRRAVQQTIASMGANNILILPGAATSAGVTFGSGSVQTLTPDDAEEILK